LSFDLTNPLIWLFGSAATAIIVSNVAWLALRLARRDLGAAGMPAAEPVRWLLVALFFALPPVFAWQKGALSPYFLGVSEIDWARSLTQGIPLTLLTVAVLVAGWAVGARRGIQTNRALGHIPSPVPVWRAPIDAALMQVHWAFYRACAVGGLALAGSRLAGSPLGEWAADPFYWGCWLGMLVVALEWVLNPLARRTMRDADTRLYVILHASIAVATAGLFIATRNFWLALLAHVAVEFVVSAWLPAPRVVLAAD